MPGDKADRVLVIGGGEVARVVINRPEKLNALNSKALKDLYRALVELEEDERVRIIVIQGQGEKAFIAGADIEELDRLDSVGYRERLGISFITVVNKIMDLGKPVIAAVRGYAFGGGCYIALACDLIIAAESARFGQQEVNLGFVGAAGLLPRLVGKHRAAEILMLGEDFGAAEAYRLGLVNRVVSDEDLDREVERICRKLLAKSSYALKFIKKSIKVALEAGISVATLYENEVASLCLGTEGSKAAIRSFLEARGRGSRQKEVGRDA